MRLFVSAMPAPDDFSDYNPSDVARDLMMPTGEPAAAVIAACLLLGMIWVAASGHFSGGAAAPHVAAARPSLQTGSGPIAPPALRRSEG